MKLSLNLSQRLAISQRLQQSLSILSLSNEDLEELIQKELLENPFLEKEEEFSWKDSQKFRMYDFLDPDFRKAASFKERSAPKDFSEGVESLKAYVIKQAQQAFFSKEIKEVLPLLISHLDEEAYLRLDLKWLAKKENISPLLMESAVKALQSLEPVGIGARSLKECLILQLRHKKINPKAEAIVRYYLSALKDKKHPYIAAELDLSLEEAKRLCRQIEKLHPNPALNFSSEPTFFVRPDLYIYKQGLEHHVIFNTENLSRVSFSKDYLRAVQQSGKLNSQDRKYLKNKTAEARGFILAIQQRQKQIKRIAYYIIEHQSAFFAKGLAGLKPLSMSDLAEKMSLHVSTISRTVNNKYAHTPHGLIALKKFFVRGACSLSGQKVSIEIIKDSIKKWISEENPEKPLSDEQLKDRILSFFKVQLGRRRVAQYRQEMKIASIQLRKRIFLDSKAAF